MGLRKILGSEVVDLRRDISHALDHPTVVVYEPALVTFKRLALGLLGVTAFSGDPQLSAVRMAAALLSESDEQEWTREEAKQLLTAVGSVPAPTHLQVSCVKGQGILLLRAVPPDTPKARELKYSGPRPMFSLLAAMRPEGMTVPKGMAMDVPVKLVEVEKGLALALYVRRGKLREATQEKDEELDEAK